MFNALNAISENGSLLRTPPWANPPLVLAIALSLAQHVAILQLEALAAIFGVAPLGAADWRAVLVASAPVLLLDEGLKLATRVRLLARERGRVGAVLPMVSSRLHGVAARAGYHGYAPVGSVDKDH
jgi:hypothetical protein